MKSSPKIKFRYSKVYDDQWREYIEPWLKRHKEKWPQDEEILKLVKILEKKWGKVERKILTEIANVSGFEWREDKIVCYIVGAKVPFSDPITLSFLPRENIYEYVDTLTHELIHNLLDNQPDNFKKSFPAYKYLHKKFPKEDQNTIIHIITHAIHKHVYLKFFGNKRLEKDRKKLRHLKAYRRSWEIIETEGYKKIIKEFIGHIK